MLYEVITDRRQGAAQQIDREQEGGADQHRERQQAAEVRSDDEPRGVRNEQPDPADDAAQRDGGSGHQRRRRHHDGAQPARVHAERARNQRQLALAAGDLGERALGQSRDVV